MKRLTAKQLRIVRKILDEGGSQRAAASAAGVSPATVNAIVKADRKADELAAAVQPEVRPMRSVQRSR